VIKNILEGLESYLRINKVSFDELVGLAHKR